MGLATESVKRRQHQLSQWGTKLDDLVSEAEEAGAEATNDYLDRLQDLKSRYESAQTKLRELSAANAEQYDDVRADLDRVWDRLEAAISRLAKQSERGEQ